MQQGNQSSRQVEITCANTYEKWFFGLSMINIDGAKHWKVGVERHWTKTEEVPASRRSDKDIK